MDSSLGHPWPVPCFIQKDVWLQARTKSLAFRTEVPMVLQKEIPFLMVLLSTAGPLGAVDFIRGDTNGDGVVSISDSSHLLANLFFGIELQCEATGDFDNDDRLNLTDAFKILDRKSTRLNSSHGYISYAVFCLKKKNKSGTESALSKHHLFARETAAAVGEA